MPGHTKIQDKNMENPCRQNANCSLDWLGKRGETLAKPCGEHNALGEIGRVFVGTRGFQQQKRRHVSLPYWASTSYK